jgi:hypothetical protein
MRRNGLGPYRQAVIVPAGNLYYFQIRTDAPPGTTLVGRGIEYEAKSETSMPVSSGMLS